MLANRPFYRRLCREAYREKPDSLEYVDIAIERARELAAVEGVHIEVVVDAAFAHRFSSIDAISRSIRSRLIESPPLIRMIKTESYDLGSSEVSAIHAYNLMRFSGYDMNEVDRICKVVLQALHPKKYPIETREAECLSDVVVLEHTGIRGVEKLREKCRDRIVSPRYLKDLLEIARDPPMLTNEGRRIATELSADVIRVLPMDPDELKKFFYG